MSTVELSMSTWNRDCVAYQAHAACYLTHYRKRLPTPALEEDPPSLAWKRRGRLEARKGESRMVWALNRQWSCLPIEHCLLND